LPLLLLDMAINTEFTAVEPGLNQPAKLIGKTETSAELFVRYWPLPLKANAISIGPALDHKKVGIVCHGIGSTHAFYLQLERVLCRQTLEISIG
jgi:hypothetical protein